ncbi:MAG: winged helix-turn-helix domain-containing protein [Ignavibacteria bacterium]
MPIPDYQSIMLPLLKFAGDKKEHSIREAIEYIADSFNLTEEERREVLPSGQ